MNIFSKLRARRVDFGCRPMLVKYQEDGAYRQSTDGHVYFEATPTRTRVQPVASPQGGLVYDAKGKVVTAAFPIRNPWKRLTPKLKRPGAARRQWLSELRMTA